MDWAKPLFGNAYVKLIRKKYENVSKSLLRVRFGEFESSNDTKKRVPYYRKDTVCGEWKEDDGGFIICGSRFSFPLCYREIVVAIKKEMEEWGKISRGS